MKSDSILQIQFVISYTAMKTIAAILFACPFQGPTQISCFLCTHLKPTNRFWCCTFRIFLLSLWLTSCVRQLHRQLKYASVVQFGVGLTLMGLVDLLINARHAVAAACRGCSVLMRHHHTYIMQKPLKAHARIHAHERTQRLPLQWILLGWAWNHDRNAQPPTTERREREKTHFTQAIYHCHLFCEVHIIHVRLCVSVYVCAVHFMPRKTSSHGNTSANNMRN